MEENAQIWLIIHKVLSEEASAEDKAELANWLSQSEENRKAFFALEQYWERGRAISPQVKAQTYERLREKLRIGIFSVPPYESEAISKPLYRKLNAQFLIAASIVLLAMIGIGLWRNSAKENWIEHVNQMGETSQVSLPDGSLIWLNADSKIKYPASFKADRREVHLEGEAYFEVDADSTRPFIVYTQELETKVLGTSFNIQAYPVDELIKVTVSSGIVSVKPSSDQVDTTAILLKPKDRVVYNRQNGQTEKNIVDPTDAMGWKDGSLVFEDANLSQISAQLERWYGIPCRAMNNAQLPIEFNGKFKNKELETVLEAIKLISDIHYEYKQDTLILMNRTPDSQ